MTNHVPVISSVSGRLGLRLTRLILFSTASAVIVPLPAQAETASHKHNQVPSASQQDRVISFNIPSQDLEQALLAFTQQAGVQLVVNPADIGQFRSAPVAGRYSKERALQILISALPLSGEWVGGNTLVVKPRAAVVRPVAVTTEPVPVSEVPKTADGEGLNVIVVTAQRRAEDVQRASVAIDVVGSEELARTKIASAYDLDRVVPALQVGQGGSFTQIYLRGVGTTARNPYADPSVTFNQDGVVIDRPSAVGPIFYDIERVEVLKGPQGTLYGRNATGGAINVLSKAPVDRFEGYLSGEYGNYDAYNVNGAINVPLTDTLAARASGMVMGRDSYLKGGYPVGSKYRDSEAQAGRLQLIWRPTDDISLRLMAEVAHDSSAGDGQVLIYPNEPNSDPWLGAANPVANATIRSRSAIQNLFRSDDNKADRNFWNVAAEFNWDLGPATLTVIPSYRHSKVNTISYDSSTRLVIDEIWGQTTIEARLAGDTPKLKWVVGGFFFDDDRSVNNDALGNRVAQWSYTEIPDIGSRNWAVFGDATVGITDRLRVLGGLRYTRETKHQYGFRYDRDATPTSNFPLADRATWTNTSWRAGFEYDVADSSMAFATVSRGFKSGGFFAAPSGNRYEPEMLTAYTVGLRNRFLDNRLQLNLEAFHWRYKDNQQSFIGFDQRGNVTLTTVNAGNARLNGFAVDVVGKMTRDDILAVDVEYLDTKYTQFSYVVPAPVFDATRTGCQVGPAFTALGAALPRRVVDCSGFEMSRAPKWSVRGRYSHEFHFDSGASLLFATSSNYRSSQQLTVEYLPAGRVDGTITFDTDLTYTSADERYSLTAFVHNLTKEATYNSGSQNTGVSSIFYGVIGQPRVFGLRGRLNF